MTWQTVKLSDVCDLQNGYAFKSTDYIEKSNVLNCRMSNIRPDGNFDIFYHPKFLPDNYGEKYKDFTLKDDDVIIAMTDMAGEPKILGVPTIVKTHGKLLLLNQRVGKLIFKRQNEIDFNYLKYVLSDQKVKNYYRKFASGGVQINLSKPDLLSVSIPLPPLSEQKRIAAILDKADEIQRKRKAAIVKLDQLAQSIFVEMFGDLTAENRVWSYGCVNDFVAGFESGKSLVADDEDSDSVYKVLKVSAVTSLYFKPHECKSLPSGYLPPSSHFVKAGDLLFSRANTVDLIGATAYVNQIPENLLLSDKLWRFVWHNPTRANPLFVRGLFQQQKFRQEISKRATGTSGSMKNISQDKVLSIAVSCPPLPLQDEFANRINKLEQLKANNIAALTKQNHLFATLQHQAFNGEL